jgi:hypothetical protein
MSTAAEHATAFSLQEFVTLKPGDKEPVCGRQEYSVTEDRPIEKVPTLRPASTVPIVPIYIMCSEAHCCCAESATSQDRTVGEAG